MKKMKDRYAENNVPGKPNPLLKQRFFFYFVFFGFISFFLAESFIAAMQKRMKNLGASHANHVQCIVIS